MKNKSKKIGKLLAASESAKNAALALKCGNKYEKLLASSEKLARKGYELARKDISSGVNEGYSNIVAANHALVSVLFIQNKYEEARIYIEDARRVPDFKQQKYSMAVDAYYGSILCYAQEYDESSLIFAQLLNDLKQNPDSADIDMYAIMHAYGNMGISFAYSDTDGFTSEQFEAPLEMLTQMKEKGYAVDDVCIKKAAYYVAANKTFLVNSAHVITHGDVTPIIQNAELCMKYCNPDGDFFMAAAMKLKAFALSRDLRFGDCSKYCDEVLAYCKAYNGKIPENPYGNLHDIAADINILIAIMHYRVNHYETAVQYFSDGLEELRLLANGKKYGNIGYIELESVIIRITAAEKAAFASEYMALSMLAIFSTQPDDKYTLDDCLAMFNQSIGHLLAISSEPYFFLRAAAIYDMISRTCEKFKRHDESKKYAECSDKNGVIALTELKKLSANPDEYKKCTSRLRSRRQLALGRGCFELNADYIKCELLMNDRPYVEPNVVFLGDINFQLGEYRRISNQLKAAVSCYDQVMKYTCNSDGSLREEFASSSLPELAMRSKTDCLLKMGEMKEARTAFGKFVQFYKATSENELDADDYSFIARSAQNLKLNPATTAEYYHQAALKSREENTNKLRTAILFNQEGINWYNASPETDDFDEISDTEKFESEQEHKHKLAAKFDHNEITAFENSYAEYMKCDQKDDEVIDFIPGLLSNLAECYSRNGDSKSLEYYQKAIFHFEKLFVSEYYLKCDSDIKSMRLYDYGVCFKCMAEIYAKNKNIEKAVEYFTKAINVFETMDIERTRYNLSYCLNSRGCLCYRLGKYQNEINDITKAIQLRSQDEGNELSLAVMYKNRAEAYEETGNTKMLHSDLCKSIEMLDKSDAPPEVLHPIYGEHLFALGICQENLDLDGKAAESYRKAILHYNALNSGGEEEIDMKAVCHFRRANCLCRRNEHEYYGALSDYNDAIKLLEQLPPSPEKDERLGAVLSSRGSLYEAFRQLDLAQIDLARAEKLGNAHKKTD